MLAALPDGLVGQLPALLGQRGLAEPAYGRLASVMRLLVEAAPKHKPLLLRCLQAELTR